MTGDMRADPAAKPDSKIGQEEVPLVVDLDGTLCRSDTLVESLIAMAMHAPVATIGALVGAGSRAKLKAMVADRHRPDATTLPYNPAVLDLLETEKSKGRRLVLATASDQRIADDVAAHLSLFDETIGTRDDTNLKAENKRQALVERYGEKGFDYIGDSRADFPVWAAARKSMAVDPSPALRRGGAEQSIDLLAIGDPQRPGTARTLLRAMRPHQWLKNLLIFLPVFAAHKFDAASLALAAVAFAAFSLVASGAYLLNDLADLEHDRKHHSKKNRPLASGALSAQQGLAGFAMCLGTGILLALLFLPSAALLVVLGYFVATTAYSLWLKRLLLIDLIVLAMLYTGRAFAGAVATATPLSDWMLLFCVFFFFALASVKRVTELRALENSDRDQASGRAYSADDVWVLSSLAVGSGLMSALVFALYATSDAVTLLYSSPRLALLTCPLLIFWTARTALLAHRGEVHDDPVVFALRDRVSLATGLAVVGVLMLASVG